MLKSFIAWLDEHLAEEGPLAIIKAFLGVMTFAAALGVIFGSNAVKAGIIVGLLLTSISMMLVLLRDRKRIRQESDVYRRLLTRYCGFLTENPKHIIRIEKWDQVLAIEPNGDARDCITIDAVVERAKLYFIRLRFSAGWDQPKRYTNRVKIKVRSLSIEGSHGASWDVTSTWLPGNKIELLSHLRFPALNGKRIRLQIEKEWPGKCIPLMRDRRTDDFTLAFTKRMPVDQVRYTVILPLGFDAYYDPIGFSSGDENFTIHSTATKEGKIEIVFTVDGMPQDRPVGMTLDLK